MSEIAKHWIDGEWTASDTVSQSVNPATIDATAASFRKDGSWTVQTEPGAKPFQV